MTIDIVHYLKFGTTLPDGTIPPRVNWYAVPKGTSAEEEKKIVEHYEKCRKIMKQSEQEETIIKVVHDALLNHKDLVGSFRKGNRKAAGVVMSYIMKSTHAKLNSGLVNSVLMQELRKEGGDAK